jgi:hypothetical protein
VPHIVIIVPSEARRRSLAAVAVEIFGANQDRCTTLVESESAAWLSEAIGLPSGEAEAPALEAAEASAEEGDADELRAAARETYTRLLAFRKELKNYMHSIDPEFDFPAPVKDALRRLHETAFGGQ